MVSFGVPQEDIAKVIGIDKKTLYKYYREELDTAAAIANTKVASMLFNKCMEGDTASILFWLKTKAQWREVSKLDIQNLDKDGEPADAKTQIDITISAEDAYKKLLGK